MAKDLLHAIVAKVKASPGATSKIRKLSDMPLINEILIDLPADKRKEISQLSILQTDDGDVYFFNFAESNALKAADGKHINPHWVVKGFDADLMPVAIKFQTIPNPILQASNRAVRQQLFQREMELTKKIPDYYLAGGIVGDSLSGMIKGDNLNYLIVKYVEGKPLFNRDSEAKLEWFDPTNLTLDDKIEIAIAAITELEKLHFQYQVQHRDLYGDNVLVHKGPNGWAVNFIDFGLGAGVLPETIDYKDLDSDNIWYANESVGLGRDASRYMAPQFLQQYRQDRLLLVEKALTSGLHIERAQEEFPLTMALSAFALQKPGARDYQETIAQLQKLRTPAPKTTPKPS